MLLHGAPNGKMVKDSRNVIPRQNMEALMWSRGARLDDEVDFRVCIWRTLASSVPGAPQIHTLKTSWSSERAPSERRSAVLAV